MAGPPESTATVLLPMEVTAFVLNQQCCNSKNYRIAPITQPNYTFLRLHENLLTSDTLDHVDIHSASPANLNQRVFNLGANQPRQERLGVYVHWTLPQLYRTGIAGVGQAANSDRQAEQKRQQGYPASSSRPVPSSQSAPNSPPAQNVAPDYSMPDFRLVPNRWLVTRKLTSQSPPKTLDPYQSWIVESDRVTNIQDMGENEDVENDYSPFVNTTSNDVTSTNAMLIDGQAEVFIGKKTDFSKWESKVVNAAPHIDLDVMTSSNPLFADFTHHNMNVFTIVDNFGYGDGKFLDSATADYSVIGWHSTDDADPMTTFQNKPTDRIPTHAERLASCALELSAPAPDFVQKWSKADGQSMPSRILCHGSMYQVSYSASAMPDHVAAEDVGQRMKQAHPVSIGATPTDAILAYCRAHLKDDLNDPALHDFEQDMIALSNLLLSADCGEDVDSFRAAADEGFKEAFTKLDAGVKWVFKQETAPAEKPAIPTAAQIQNLLQLNALQQTRDTAARELTDLRWALFARWWNFIAGFIDHDKPEQYRVFLDEVKVRLDEMITRLSQLEGQISGKDGKQADLLQLGDVAADYFYQRKEPTMLFSNLGRGWAQDFINPSKVRLCSSTFSQLVPADGTDKVLPKFLETMDGVDSDKQRRIPLALSTGVKALLSEFSRLNTEFATTDQDKPEQILPYFHTGKKDQGLRGRDFWQATQPWKPIMIEWEAIYYHIPIDAWNFREYDNLSHWGAKTIHYGANTELSKVPNIDLNRQHVSGRNILVPQASSTLTNALQTVFENTPQADLIASFAEAHPEAKLSDMKDDQKVAWLEKEKKELIDTVSSLDIVSAPMTGLTSHFLTLHEGSHVKPLIRLPNQAPVPIDAAATALAKAFTSDNSITPGRAKDLATDLIKQMQTETNRTPYGSSVQQESDSVSPLKPVTHGQLIFTKVNVIDKFGQVISAINPKPLRRNQKLKPMLPCISDSYYPGTVDDNDPTGTGARPNTVVAQDTGACPFICLTPSINQPARINASFVQKVDGAWRRCSEWDDPIWGWLVVNYADNGLQVFFADGTFYREVRMGGKWGSVAGRKFLPFDKPTGQNPDVKARDVAQLDFLIEKLSAKGDATYLQGMVDMILQSIDDKQAHAPRSYATNASAIVGKPLALVNAGWSLELAHAENDNWSTSNQTMPSRTLLDSGTLLAEGNLGKTRDMPKNATGRQFAEGDPRGYTFPIKLGDAERSFDGLVGYFPLNTNQSVSPPVKSTSDLDLSKLYTYFVKTVPSDSKVKGTDPRISLLKDSKDDKSSILTPLQLTPYHLNSYVDPTGLKLHDAKLKVFGLIVDPFLPIHAYSGILPNKSLKLPAWAVEQALKKMTAFWKAGPLVVTKDVPRQFSESRALKSDNYSQLLAPPQAVSKAQVTSSATTPAVPPPGSVIPPTNPLPIADGPDSKIPLVSIPLAPPMASQSGGEAVYRWLQPYWVLHGQADPTVKSTQPVYGTRFNAMGISDDAASAADAATLRLEQGPYTAIEGFLQVVKPLSDAL